MFLLSFEFLSNCYFLAHYYTGNKIRHQHFPRWRVTIDVPTIQRLILGWECGRVATSTPWPGRRCSVAANLPILLESLPGQSPCWRSQKKEVRANVVIAMSCLLPHLDLKLLEIKLYTSLYHVLKCFKYSENVGG